MAAGTRTDKDKKIRVISEEFKVVLVPQRKREPEVVKSTTGEDTVV